LVVRSPVRVGRHDTSERGKREPGANPGLPRSGKRERTPEPAPWPDEALGQQAWEAAVSRNPRRRRRKTLASPKTCHWSAHLAGVRWSEVSREDRADGLREADRLIHCAHPPRPASSENTSATLLSSSRGEG